MCHACVAYGVCAYGGALRVLRSVRGEAAIAAAREGPWVGSGESRAPPAARYYGETRSQDAERTGGSSPRANTSNTLNRAICRILFIASSAATLYASASVG